MTAAEQPNFSVLSWPNRKSDVADRLVVQLPQPTVHEPLVHLVASVEPSVVFASLAAQCARAVCDECTIDIVDGVHARYRIAHPPRPASTGGLRRLADRAATTPDHLVRLRFAHPADADTDPRGRAAHGAREEYHGIATFVWHHRVATRADRTTVAALLQQAMHIVASQRSEQAAHATAANAENLTLALQSSRRIGAAIGILMSLHKITEDEAFDVLRATSQRTNRKLRDLAAEVVDTGWLDPDLLRTSPSASAPHQDRGASADLR